MSAEPPDRVVRLGEICGLYGIRGWVKILSFTDPRTNLFDYSGWLLEQPDGPVACEVEETRQAGKHLLAKLAGVDDRETARKLIGTAISIPRSELPPCAPGEYYWTDLVGLRVVTPAGEPLGTVAKLIATGANDVLVLDGGDEQMIPYVPGDIVRDVDLDAGRMVVDWDAAYWE